MTAVPNHRIAKAVLSAISDATIGPYGIVALARTITARAADIETNPRAIAAVARQVAHEGDLAYHAPDGKVAQAPHGLHAATANALANPEAVGDFSRLPIVKWVDGLVRSGKVASGGRIVLRPKERPNAYR